ncbi:SDR family oxidoreductase [Emticicia sp. 21SJ11W-3]|uniref:SDR family oxidoreductase n=1 Tax=Emticicia sp. 21SJ11W-3 TaxID=2916755 RepID=UPI00209EAB4E|nr:NAD(P)H-binding protein [Emticicia sp. 21SJ11W-3]UTA68077.1 NAD(P)H-binding protein [Emticicia sp. 21SJ11W-3]
MKKIVVFGATGMLGKPVTKALIEAGFEVSVMVRNEPQAADFLEGAKIIKGNLKNEADVEKAIRGQDGVFLSLSVLQTEKESDWHTEQQGIDTILAVAKREGIKRIGYLSSLVHLYQGMDGFDWWVFRVKQEAVSKIKTAGIPYTIFYPSTFMESIFYQSRQGNMIALGGTSAYPLYYIAADDYALQVANSFKILADENKEYVVQGTEAFTQDEAAKLFVKYYTKEKLRTIWAPMFMMKLMGVISRKFDYGYHIVTALNKYPEKFEAANTWEELGKPAITLKAFARQLSLKP